jgi:uncharacterized membrane protein YeaQ/YmgE (transglycosylase-associated protein family)
MARIWRYEVRRSLSAWRRTRALWRKRRGWFALIVVGIPLLAGGAVAGWVASNRGLPTSAREWLLLAAATLGSVILSGVAIYVLQLVLVFCSEPYRNDARLRARIAATLRVLDAARTRIADLETKLPDHMLSDLEALEARASEAYHAWSGLSIIDYAKTEFASAKKKVQEFDAAAGRLVRYRNLSAQVWVLQASLIAIATALAKNESPKRIASLREASYLCLRFLLDHCQRLRLTGSDAFPDNLALPADLQLAKGPASRLLSSPGSSE